MTERGFLEYYEKRNIIPVSQNIEDFAGHVRRRTALYRGLGLSSLSFRGSQVLEFGPGTGDNAIVTLGFEPEKLTLVDANPASIEALQSKVVALDPNRVELVKADFNSDDLSLRLEGKRFDIVLAEACLPGQVAPISSLRKISNLVCDSAGMLVVTAADDMSTLSELCRRYMKPAIVNSSNGAFDDAVEIACRVFGSHLDALPQASRSVHDWVLDQIVHPWPHGWALSMNDAIDELVDFDFLGSSPNFFEDWRWYKQFADKSEEWSGLASKRWTQVAPYTLDNRIEMGNVSFASFSNGNKLIDLCRKFGHLSYDAWTNDSYSNIDEVENVLNEICGELSDRPEFFGTVRSIKDYCVGLTRLANGDLSYPYNEFKSWWGRGQQYISFSRKI
jgi:ubiquinone/menaquinone biosynthesis C-methylase UbiE